MRDARALIAEWRERRRYLTDHAHHEAAAADQAFVYNRCADELEAAVSLLGEPETPAPVLSFAGFSAVNRLRCESPSGFNHPLRSWSSSDWMTAVVGELGEAANVVKKLNRYRDGVPGNKASEADLRQHLRKECGDVFVYLDLLCQSLGFSVADAAVEVFNAKSAEIGCPLVIEVGRPAESPVSGGTEK